MYNFPKFKAMKKFIAFFLITFSLASCSVDDDPNYYFEVLPVDSVDIPDEFVMGETYPITIYYYMPTNCHSFRDFYYNKDNNERTVAPITYVFEDNDCDTLTDELVEATFNFHVTSNGSYIFKFWQGENDAEEDNYLTIEVPVTE